MKIQQSQTHDQGKYANKWKLGFDDFTGMKYIYIGLIIRKLLILYYL